MADGQTNGNGPTANGNGSIPYGNKELDRLESIVANVYAMRQEFLQGFQNVGDGELDELCSWPGPDTLQAQFYRTLYDRTSVATRVCQLYPKECWQVTPLVYEDESSQHITPFEAAWDGLGKKLTGNGKSWHREEQGSLIWSYLQRADELSGIGVYGIMLLGINDGKLLEQPVDGVLPDGAARDISGVSESGTTSADQESKNIYGDKNLSPTDMVSPLMSTLGTDAQYFQTQFSPMYLPNGQQGGKSSLKMKGKGKSKELLFIRCFDESLVQVVQYEASMRSPRFGQPVMYLVTLNDPRQPHTGIGLPLSTVRVHWSRIVHLADNLGSSEIFGVPRQRPIINNIMDLRKLYGGSAEMYWRGAFPGLSIETHPQLGGDVLVDRAGLRDMMTDYHQRLQRWISLMGMTAKSLAPQVVDPTPQITVQLEAICIYLGCPVRVFKGSERGELASSQDDAAWNDRLRHRQNLYLTPRVVAPFIDRLIQIGVLPEPKAKASDGGSKAEPGRGNNPDKTAKENPFLNGKGTVGGKKLDELGKDQEPTENADDQEQEDDGAEDSRGGNPFAKSKPGVGGKSPLQQGKDLNDDEEDGEYANDKGEEEEPGYSVEWPDLDSLGDKDKATVALTETQAMAAYIQGDVESMVPRRDYFIRTLHWEDEEADAVIADAKAQEEEKQQEAEDLAAEHGLEPVPPEGFQKPEPPGGFPPPAGGPPGGGGGFPPQQPKAQPGSPPQPGQSQPGKPPMGQTSQRGGNQSQAQYTGFKGTRNESAVDVAGLKRVAKWLSKNGLMPGYGQVFVNGGHVWYVGGDGDEIPFEKRNVLGKHFSLLVEKRLGEIVGVEEVTYESEDFPNRGEGWRQVYPKEQDWVENAFCPTGKGGGVDDSCGKGDDSPFSVKPPKKLYRGVLEGGKGAGTYSLGKGLYSTPTKSFLKGFKFDKIVELDPKEAFPRNPLVLRTASHFSDWLLKESGLKNMREFGAKYPDPGEFVKSKGYDGVVAGDEVVKYSSPTSNTAANGAAVKAILSKYDEESLDGLLVYLNEGERKAIVDRMDWYDKSDEGDPATDVENALIDWLGKDNVESVNEGARPMGEGWVELVRQVVRNAFCPTGEGGGVDDSCGKDEGKGSAEGTVPDYKRFNKVMGLGEFVHKRVGEVLEQAGERGASLRQIARGINGKGSTAYGDISHGEVRAALESLEVAYDGDKVRLSKHVRNANPDGCNQYTGPGCDGGKSVKELSDDARDASAHALETTDSNLTPLDALYAHAEAADIAAGDARGWLKNGNLQKAAVSHEMAILDHYQAVQHAKDPKLFTAHQDAEQAHRMARDGVVDEMMKKGGHEGWITSKALEASRFTDTSRKDTYPQFGNRKDIAEWHMNQANFHAEEADRRHEQEKGDPAYSHEEAAYWHGKARDAYERGTTTNQFCPTGQGGGVDATCSPSTSTQEGPMGLKAKARAMLAKVWGKGRELEHKYLEKHYEAGQALAKQVAKERGLSDAHVERVGRVLAYADSAARWTQWYGVHAVLDLVGGPVLGTAGAKASYYIPTASLAYIGLHMAKEAIGGKDPIALMKRAREKLEKETYLKERDAKVKDIKPRPEKQARLGLEELPQRNQQTNEEEERG